MGLTAFRGKTVLVTGSTGFKGSWLSIWLLQLGAKVVGYALKPRTRRDNFAVCGLDKKITQIYGDIRDSKKLTAVFTRHRPAIAFHLAAQPLVLESYRTPAETFDVNVMGTVNFLESLRETPSVKAAVVVTTDKVYENTLHPRAFRESDPLGGHDPYSGSKAAAEIVTQSYLRSFFSSSKVCKVATARAGNVIGGGDWSPNRIVPDCIRALEARKPLKLRHPSAIRPWQHVLEPLHGYLLLAAALYQKGHGFSGVWNFGPNPAQHQTVDQLVKALQNAWKGQKMIAQPLRRLGPWEAGELRLNSAKARLKLGWESRLTFRQAVEWTVGEYRARNRGSDFLYGQQVGQISRFMILDSRKLK